VREESALKAELATIEAFEATNAALAATNKAKAEAKKAASAGAAGMGAGAATEAPVRAPSAPRSARTRPARTAPMPGEEDADAAAMETDAAPAAAPVDPDADTDGDEDEHDRDSLSGDLASDGELEEEAEEEADVALPLAADSDADANTSAPKVSASAPAASHFYPYPFRAPSTPLLLYDAKRCAAYAASARLAFDAALDAAPTSNTRRGLWALSARYIPLWCHVASAGESPDEVLAEAHVDAAKAAWVAALWRQRAAQPCELRAAAVALPGGLAFALVGEHIGADFNLAYLDSCRAALPAGMASETRGALYRSAVLSFLASAAAEGARTAVKVSCAAEWRYDPDAELLRLQEYALVRPCGGDGTDGTDGKDDACTRKVKIPPGMSKAKALQRGNKAALAQTRKDGEHLRKDFYPKMLKAGEAAGVVSSWCRIESGSPVVVPLFPGCLFAKTRLRLAGARIYATRAALQDAAVKEVESYGGAVFVAQLAAPDAAAVADAALTRACMGDLLPKLTRADEDAEATFVPPPGAHTTGELLDAFMAAQRRSYGKNGDDDNDAEMEAEAVVA
jgi:hypothetical protein